ncbi:MAG: peptide ABC transporter substrate-binding protein [Verrucomicrobia bacterium]|nr:peptide ABC transporter substrate-binding protein [Verrucomicrobiota bacterium]
MALAERVEISEDNRIYTFYLRETFWSDGTPITAWDFEKSWKDILNPDFPAMNAHLLYPIKNAEGAKMGKASLSEVGIHSLDARVLEVTLENPTPYFLELASFCVFYPVNSEIDHSNPDWAMQPGKTFLCSGPFLLKEWKRNNTIVLERNPYYYKAGDVILEEINFSMVDSEMTALQMYEKGQIDILGQPLIAIPTDAINEVAEKEDLQITQIPATTFCAFNVDRYPFNNVNIRKAFCYAMNREQIVRNITQLSEQPALGIIPPLLKRRGNRSNFFKDADIETARSLFQKGLQELNISAEDFPTVKYIYSKAESNHKIAQALQQQWFEALGVYVELESIDKKFLLHLLKGRNYQMAQSFWMAQYRDPFNIFERFKYKENVKNYPNWQNETYVQLLNKSCEARSDKERFALLDQAEAIFLDEMPIAPIFHWNSAYIAKPYVKSIGFEPIGNGFFERVYIDVEAKQDLR